MKTTGNKKQLTSERNVIEQLGGPKQIHQGLLEYMSEVRFLESKRTELLEQYPDKWIAIAGGEIVAVADSIDNVLIELDEREIARADAVVEFMDTNPRNLIL